MTLDAPTLAQACDCSIMTASNWAPWVSKAAETWGIDTPERLAVWLAQIAHESGRFHWVEEVWGPTVPQRGYEGRRDLGNVKQGDGYKYRGRGLIQLTGRANYAAFRDGCAQRVAGVRDFEEDPDALLSPKWASHSAGWFWHEKDLNPLADAGAFEAVTKRINGGLNGIGDRLVLWTSARRALGV